MVIFFYFTTFLGELMMNDKSLKIWKDLMRFDEISWLVSMVIFNYFTTFLGELMMNDKT